jgi:hypothetical protein
MGNTGGLDRQHTVAIRDCPGRPWSAPRGVALFMERCFWMVRRVDAALASSDRRDEPAKTIAAAMSSLEWAFATASVARPRRRERRDRRRLHRCLARALDAHERLDVDQRALACDARPEPLGVGAVGWRERRAAVSLARIPPPIGVLTRALERAARPREPSDRAPLEGIVRLYLLGSSSTALG